VPEDAASQSRSARSARARGATALAVLGAAALHAGLARGEDPVAAAPPPPSASASSSAPIAVPWSGTSGGSAREGLDPFPSTGQYLSYGFAFHSEGVVATGKVCPAAASESCILGSGGGISLSGAVRTQLYSLGVVYEARFHDSNNIYQRGVLQQLRGEWRLRPRGLDLTESIHPLIGAGAGIAGYGDNWSLATLGAAGHAMLGAEWDLGVKLSMTFAIAYRVIYFRAFEDPSKQFREAGVAQMLGLQLGLELHEPL